MRTEKRYTRPTYKINNKIYSIFNQLCSCARPEREKVSKRAAWYASVNILERNNASGYVYVTGNVC